MQTPSTFIAQEDLQKKVEELGRRISLDYEGEDLVVVCVLKGAFMFCADLIKNIERPLRMEFIQVSSYGDEKTSSGECQLLLDLTGSIEGQNVLIVEDIVDTGLTINYLEKLLWARRPKTLRLATLLYKPSNLKHEVNIDYLAYEIEDQFVVGYGLDYAGLYRELPYIGLLGDN